LPVIAGSEEVDADWENKDSCDWFSCDDDGEDADAVKWLARITHMFRKKLTASDTGMHAGSVPCGAAEGCFPPLDYSRHKSSWPRICTTPRGSSYLLRSFHVQC